MRLNNKGWYGTVRVCRYDIRMVWYGTVRYGYVTAWNGMAWPGTIWYSMVRLRYGMVRYGAVMV